MPNPYYTPTGTPSNQTRGTSALVRNEFDNIQTGFDDVYSEILALAAAIGVAVTVSEVPLASSSTTDIGNGYGPVLLLTGSVPINSFGANYKGAIFLRFQGSLQINHSATLQCPGAVNITTQADDACIAVPIGDPANGWRIMAYCRVSQGIIDDIAVKTSSTYADPAWLTSLAWSKITGKPTTLAGYGITDAPQKDGTGATGTWGINITGWAKSAGAGADIASAATINLTARTGNVVRITGTTSTTAITMNNGDVVLAIAAAAWPINVAGVLTYTCTAEDVVLLTQDDDGVQHFHVLRADDKPLEEPPVFDIDASVAANALTITLNPCFVNFRSTTLTDGTPVKRQVASAASVIVASGATLGTIANQAARLAVLAIDNAGTVELAVVNMAGGANLDETTLISTTAMSAAADSIATIYSTTSRSNVAFRVVGFIDITQETPGTWASDPTKVQPMGGTTVAVVAGIGHGTRSNVKASRALSTTYYNTSGRVRLVDVACRTTTNSQTATVTLGNGDSLPFIFTGGGTETSNARAIFFVKPGESYSVAADGTTPSIDLWIEQE